MKILVLMGSPRKNGNTTALAKVFIDEAEKLGNTCEAVYLYDKKIGPCLACRGCQSDWEKPACVQKDDMTEIIDKVMESDMIVFASPIYSWYCTAPTKAAMDRLVYCLNKYYGGEKGPSIWKGKKVAAVTTCGYKTEKGTDLWDEGLRRYCKHSGLTYLGLTAQRHLGYDVEFMDEKKEKETRDFVLSILTEK